MKNKISFVFPSRKRPHKAISTIENLFNKSKKSENIEVVFVFDSDDQDSIEKILNSTIAKENNVKHVIVEREEQNFGELYNIGFLETTHEVIGIIADDLDIQTENWDTLVLEKCNEVPDDIYLIAPDDGKRVMATHFFVSRKVVGIMGFLQPPWFVADFGDMWYTRVFEAVDRFFKLYSVRFIHMHYCYGKSEIDETYEDATKRRQGVLNFKDPEHPYNKYGHVRVKQIEDLKKQKGNG
tara:strand:+ start:29 stop:745 length:717 start_codon:yes stop_codon:yes gene_type:complete